MRATSGILALVVALVVTSAASAAPRQDISARLTATKPGDATGFRISASYVNPSDPAAKPPSLRRATLQLPPGTRIHPENAATCTQSEVVLLLVGASACPPQSLVGMGTATADTGLPVPLRILSLDLTLINAPGAILFLARERSLGIRQIARGTIVGRRTIDVELPEIPGTPPGGGAFVSEQFEIARIARTVDGEKTGYLTAPARCRQGRWQGERIHSYFDGVVERAGFSSPCHDNVVSSGAQRR